MNKRIFDFIIKMQRVKLLPREENYPEVGTFVTAFFKPQNKNCPEIYPVCKLKQLLDKDVQNFRGYFVEINFY